MLTFTQEQKTYTIGDVTIGGQPGENPTVLMGSIFYQGHRIVSDPAKGIFDKQKAKDLLDKEAEISSITGNPRIIDVIGDTTPALINYLEFVAANSTSPILVDSPIAKVRMDAIRHFAKTEVLQRLVYNSIEDHHSEEELACIKECGIKTAVILAFNVKSIRPKKRIKLLEEKLLGAAEKAGVENMLIDTGVLDIPSISWSSQAIWEIKNKLGYPGGCAPANALYQWKKKKPKGSPEFEVCGTSSYLLPIGWGANFILYGPIGNASWVYPACATLDAIIAYGEQGKGINIKKEHPLYQMF